MINNNLGKFSLINYRDIDLTLFGDSAKFYLSQINLLKSKIIGDVNEGFIILEPYYFGYIVNYLFVKEDNYDNLIIYSLLDSSITYCNREKNKLYLKIVFSNDLSKSLENYALSHNMKLISSQKIYLLKTIDVRNSVGERWINKRMRSVTERFLTKGYKIASFSEAPELILSKLKKYSIEKNIIGHEMPMDINPFSIDYDLHLSYILWKEDEPISYLCIKRYGDSVVVKENFCFNQYISTGASILPLAYFAEALWKDSSILRVSFIILDSNEIVNRMVQREYSQFPLNSTIQKIYSTVCE